MKKTRVAPSSNPIVLFCGGFVPPTSSAIKDITSLRHKLNEYVLLNGCGDFELFRPEEITSWRDDGVFPDLFSFEIELAAICSAVVLIIESPGSIAELGAFSQHPELKNKLMVVNTNDYVYENSFINLGILRDIKNSETSEVFYFPWDSKNPASAKNTLMGEIVDSVNEFLLNFGGSELFNIKKGSHVTVFICELVSLFIALQLSEIERYLETLGFSISRKELQRKLHLLCEFKIIDTEYYGSLFYVRTKTSFNDVKFRYKQKKHTPSEVKLGCQRFYASAKHTKRLGAIEAYKERQK